jgi:hypothetical protein
LHDLFRLHDRKGEVAKLSAEMEAILLGSSQEAAVHPVPCPAAPEQGVLLREDERQRFNNS